VFRLIVIAGTSWMLAISGVVDGDFQTAAVTRTGGAGSATLDGTRLFATSANCIACHNGLSSPTGEDTSIGTSWRASIMANSSRDPYWQASVRRETIDHPQVTAEIQDECSVCHMPMSHTAEHTSGRKGAIFDHLPVTSKTGAMSDLAHDGVSCTLCHQVTPQKLGDPSSFTGGYVIDTRTPPEQRPVYGPYQIDPGLVRVMHSVTGFNPTEGTHIRESELCATCHTLYTTARGADGEPTGKLPEQMPFLEWQHSSYASERSCQSCHMPPVGQPSPIASVLGQPRDGMSRHTFWGGNFLVLRMLNRYRADLGVVALPEELETSARGTLDQLRTDTARIAIDSTAVRDGQLAIAVSVDNLTGHKLPTAYPSRRAWIHLVVRDGSGRTVFESGKAEANGAIDGNDNDVDPLKYEPHYREITQPGEVQIYESIMVDSRGEVTTGLLQGVRYAKDNRLLPHGFDKSTALPDIAVQGDASTDPDFTANGDRLAYRIPLGAAAGPYTIEATLLYQPIGFRWANNLRPYSAEEPRRFVAYFDSLATGTTAVLAKARAAVQR
jgi:hypothetical protein